MREQFTFYRSFLRGISRIRKDADRCKAYDAIVTYALDGKEPDLDKLPDAVSIAFEFAKPVLDKAARNAANAKRNGANSERNASESNRSGSESERTESDNEVGFETPCITERERERERDRERDRDRDRDRERDGEPEPMLEATPRAGARELASALGVGDDPFGRTEMSDYYDEQARQIKRIMEGLQSSFDFSKLDALIPPGWVRDAKGNVVMEGSAE